MTLLGEGHCRVMLVFCVGNWMTTSCAIYWLKVKSHKDEKRKTSKGCNICSRSEERPHIKWSLGLGWGAELLSKLELLSHFYHVWIQMSLQTKGMGPSKRKGRITFCSAYYFFLVQLNHWLVGRAVAGNCDRNEARRSLQLALLSCVNTNIPTNERDGSL